MGFRLFKQKGKAAKGRWKKALLRTDRLVCLALLLTFALIRAADPYPVELLRLKVFDAYQRFHPRPIPPPEQKPVTIVDIDENSLASLGQWPWPRNIIAQIVQNLTDMGAALVAFDMVFAEPDRMNPNTIADVLTQLPDNLRGTLRDMPSNDRILAEAMAKSRVVLGQATFWGELDETARPPLKASVAFKGPKPVGLVPTLPNLIRNIPEFEAAAAGVGVFSLAPELDGVVRRVPTFFAVLGKDGTEASFYPTLPVEMVRVVLGKRTTIVSTDFAGVQFLGIDNRLGRTITDRRGRVWPYFSKSDPAKYVPAREVLYGTADPKLIQGKLVIIGTSAAGLLDIRSTPTESVIPGVEVHAQFIESMFLNQFLIRPNYINSVEMALLVAGGLLMIWLVPIVGARWTMFLFLGIAGGGVGASIYLFVEHKILLNVLYPSLSILLLYTILTYWGYAQEEAQKRQVRAAFGHYLAPAMVERLADDPSHLRLGGDRRDMTMLFCDVRGFTTISEQFDAVGLTSLINKLLTPLTEVILRRNGTVDKYMGDCIMAFWNAPIDDPDHPRHACLAALEMNAAMGPLNERLEKEAIAEGRKHIPLKIGIGVNSGEVVVGNMGSDQRFDYSVLGDAVNLASRLEGQCKTYGVDLVIGENTEKVVRDLAVLELDLIRVKGKMVPVRIFTVQGDAEVAKSEDFLALKAEHEATLAAYRDKDWDKAEAGLAKCRAIMGRFHLGGLYDLYQERIDAFREAPPPDEWDGVFVATSK